jgi:hypothetical protein
MPEGIAGLAKVPPRPKSLNFRCMHCGTDPMMILCSFSPLPTGGNYLVTYGCGNPACRFILTAQIVEKRILVDSGLLGPDGVPV